MRHPLVILAVVVGLYAAVCVLAFVFQRRLVFFPSRDLFATPGQAGMAYRDVTFRADDDVELHGWFVPASGAKRILLFCHGNAGNISDRLESIRVFHDLGLSVFIFDYRGYGRSGGQVSEAGTYRDARAAYRYLLDTEGARAEDILFFGRSLGGSVAIELATEFRPAALIVESCFPTIADVGARAYPFLPVRPLMRVRYDSTERIRRVDCPKLFIHSRDDEIVPFDLGRRLHDMAASPKEFLEIRGDHNAGFVVSGGLYRGGLERFLHALD
jgi:fermentation-respiration switch protein FrsA (DUF1100 family)